MKLWGNLFKALVLIIVLLAIAFDVLLYNFCEKQRIQLDSISKQQKLESQLNDNKFKYQQGQVERISNDLLNIELQIKNQSESLVQQKDALAAQKDTLLQEVEKRQQIENDSKSIQTSLVDIKAEADAIKQDVKGWQKDYVSVLAELEKKMDDSQGEIKSLEKNLVALNIPELKMNIDSLKADIEKITLPSNNSSNNTLSAADNKAQSTQTPSQ